MHYGPLVISVNGYQIEPNSAQEKMIQHPLVGGIVLFEYNYQSKEQLSQLASQIKHLAQEANKEIIIMVDQEGGAVQRFFKNESPIPSAKTLGEIYDINPETSVEYAYKLGLKVGSELKNCHVDIMLGPVVDLDNGNAVISGKDRSYHQDPNIVSHIAEAYIEGLKESGINATLKHFPGHGANIGDSHVTLPFDHRTIKELNAQDLLPFKNLIETDSIDAIMPAHVVYPKIDADNTAVTSKIWLKDILRDELHFDGVIISDCLTMKGAGEQRDIDKVLKTLQNTDLVMYTNKTEQEYADLLSAMEKHPIQPSKESQERIENWLMINPSLTKEIYEEYTSFYFEG